MFDLVVVYGAIGEALNEAFLKIGKESSYYPELDEAIQAGLRLSNGQNEVSILFSPGFAALINSILTQIEENFSKRLFLVY